MTKSNNTTLNALDLGRIREEAMDFANVGIYRYRFNGEVVFMDQGCIRLLDLEDSINSPAELCGRNIASMLEYIDEPKRLRSATKEHQSVRNFEYHFRTLTGKERWSYHNSYLVTDPETGEEMLQVIVQDITALKAANRALEESESRYRALAEQSAQGIFVILVAGARIVFANKAFASITGYSAEELTSMTGEDIWQRIHPDDLPLLKSLYEARRAGNGQPKEYELRMKHGDGSFRWFSMHVSLIEFEGAPASQVSVTDIHHKKLEEELEQEQALNMQHMQKLESLGVLAGGIAHDFNNLLAVVMANADLASTLAGEDSPFKGNLDNIVTASDQASELCGQLLSYAGQTPIEKRPIRLSKLFNDTLSLLNVSISKKIRLSYVGDDNLPPINGDRSQIRQILLNLITNASEAIGEEVGTIEVTTVSYLTNRSLQMLRFGDELHEGSYLYMEVKDSGAGMDKATQHRIFDPFFTTKFIGRGLGLSAVQGILRAHNATFEIESAPGEGTRFRIYFPISKTDPPPALLQPAEEQERLKLSGCVLCVDDEPKVLGALTSILKYFGLEVITAIDGHDALTKYQQHREKITVVILDIAMPKKDGIELFDDLRSINPTLPVLFASGYNKDQHIQSLERDGQTKFLRKPFTISALGRSLGSLLLNAKASSR